MRRSTALLLTGLLLALATSCVSDEDGQLGTSSTGGASADGSVSGDDTQQVGLVGDACQTAADCSDPPDAECFTDQAAQFGVVYKGGYCSKGCQTAPGEPDIDCGTGMCVTSSVSNESGSMSQSYCAKPCQDISDCRGAEGYHCQLLPFNLGGYCAP